LRLGAFARELLRADSILPSVRIARILACGYDLPPIRGD
jgi:hypothetical protein